MKRQSEAIESKVDTECAAWLCMTGHIPYHMTTPSVQLLLMLCKAGRTMHGRTACQRLKKALMQVDHTRHTTTRQSCKQNTSGKDDILLRKLPLTCEDAEQDEDRYEQSYSPHLGGLVCSCLIVRNASLVVNCLRRVRELSKRERLEFNRVNEFSRRPAQTRLTQNSSGTLEVQVRCVRQISRRAHQCFKLRNQAHHTSSVPVPCFRCPGAFSTNRFLCGSSWHALGPSLTTLSY